MIWLRALVALGLILGGWGLYTLYSRRVLRRLRQRELRLPQYRAGGPAVLYFTTPGCMPCKTAQRPALSELQGRLARQLQVIEVDASADPATADYWGVLSVPTTFVIDSDGHPRSVNHGVATADTLLRQLQAAEGRVLLAVGQGGSSEVHPDYN